MPLWVMIIAPLAIGLIYFVLKSRDDKFQFLRMCIVGGRATGKAAASSSQVARFETQVLTESDNLAQLMDLSGR